MDTKTKYHAINGWTKERMIQIIREKMKDHPSLSLSGGCTYLAQDGNRCAVGVFIPDEHCTLAFGEGVRRLLLDNPDLRSKMPLEVEGLVKMQDVHDKYAEDAFKKCDPRPELIRWIEENVEDR